MKKDAVLVIDDSFWAATQPVVMGGNVELEKWLEGRDAFFNHLIFKTSGSSGVEKWIALSKDALEWSARRVIEYLGITQDDVLGLALPTHHVGGFGLEARAYFSGARLVRFDEGWSPDEFAGWCEREKVTVGSLVPTQVNDLVGLGLRGAESLRVIVVGGGQLSEQLAGEARALGWPVQPSYGMTETASQVATGDGLPLMSGWEARIEDGRLALKGGALLSRVICRREGEYESVDPKSEGWFLTNDLAELIEGKLEILGRADRRVKILGELVDLERVECQWRELLESEVIVTIRPEERRGVSLWLLVEGKVRDLESFNRRMPGLERLSGWGFSDRLPRGLLGKVDRSKVTEINVDYVCAKGQTGFI